MTGLTGSGTGCFIAVPIVATVDIKGLSPSQSHSAHESTLNFYRIVSYLTCEWKEETELDVVGPVWVIVVRSLVEVFLDAAAAAFSSWTRHW